ncbi:MAG: ankyrin repeat domain-containing protein [Rehaibacterium terrae]|uniref:ankyrin repeat domain-containing protein n=1 Tax=Rehaibacterium terrae TaxID=1341696 RepID=UPI00391AA912
MPDRGDTRVGAALIASAVGLALAALPLFLAHPAALAGLWLAWVPFGLAAGWWLGTRTPGELWRDAVVLGLLWTAALLSFALLLAWPLQRLQQAPSLGGVLALGAACGLGLFAFWRTWPATGRALRAGGSLAELRVAVRHGAGLAWRGFGVALTLAGALLPLLLLAWPGLVEGAARDWLLPAGIVAVATMPLLAAWLGEPPEVAETVGLLPVTTARAYGGETMPVVEDEADAGQSLESRLYLAARLGRIEQALDLLEAGADPHALPPPEGRDQRTLAMLAAVHVDLRLLRALIAAGVDLNLAHAGLTPLLAATRDSWHGRVEAVMTLLANGADPRVVDADGNTPLHHAARSTDPGVAALLLDAGAALDAVNHEGLSPLGVACAAGNWRLAKFLIERGAHNEPAGGQPVLLAAAGGDDDPAGVNLLLRHKARVDARDQRGRTALLVACRADNAEIVAALLAAGADRNAHDDEGLTPLLAASAAGSLAALRVLIPTQPDPGAVDAAGRNALALLMQARQADPEIVPLLLRLGVDPGQRDRDGRRPLDLAVAAGRWRLVRALDPLHPLPSSLLDESEDALDEPEQSPESLLRDALIARRFDEAARMLPLAPPEAASALLPVFADECDLDLFDWLLRHGVDPERPLPGGGDGVAFRLLARGRHAAPALRRLLARGVGIGGRGGLARFLVACAGDRSHAGEHEALALDLLARGADPFGKNPAGDPPLALALRLGWSRLALALLATGADPNQRDARGLSPLHLACARGDAALVKALVRHGASPEARSPDGQTPLGLALASGRRELAHWLEWRQWRLPGRPLQPADLPAAAMVGDRDAVERLLELGLPIDAVDVQGCSALLRAAGGGHAALVELLLARGADVALSACTGATPLSAAVSMRHPQIVERLLVAGAAVDQALPGGITPLMVAAALGLDDMCRRLLAGGADIAAQDGQGHGALHCAAIQAFQSRDRDRVVRLFDLLLRAGAGADAPAQGGLTPLLLVLGARAEPGSSCDEDTVLAALERLLAENVALDVQERRGFGPLHLACLHGLRRVVRRLLRAGADPGLRDTLNRTPHDIAVLRGFVDVAAEFEPARGQVSLARFLREPPRE